MSHPEGAVPSGSHDAGRFHETADTVADSGNEQDADEDALEQLLYMADVQRVSAEQGWLTPLRASRGHQ